MSNWQIKLTWFWRNTVVPEAIGIFKIAVVVVIFIALLP